MKMDISNKYINDCLGVLLIASYDISIAATTDKEYCTGISDLARMSAVKCKNFDHLHKLIVAKHMIANLLFTNIKKTVEFYLTNHAAQSQDFFADAMNRTQKALAEIYTCNFKICTHLSKDEQLNELYRQLSLNNDLLKYALVVSSNAFQKCSLLSSCTIIC